MGQNQVNLTGFWQDNSGGKYLVRQVGNQIYWVDDARPQYINAFHGTVNGSAIRGQWADLPGGKTQHSGTLELHIESNDRLVRVDSGGTAFGGSVFVRTGSAAATAAANDRSRMASDPIVGVWKWDTGAVITITPNGTFSGSGSSGRWRVISGNDQLYELTWASGSGGPVHVAADRQHLEDPKSPKTRVLATRVR
jgi:hypothetical protein